MPSTYLPVQEPARTVPVAFECDLCVIGGSCTGVFAAVRAARMGLSVALVEQNSIFGGMATAAQVNDWHSLLDAHEETQIIGGLTLEVLNRLRTRNAVQDRRRRDRGPYFVFNSAELALELDALVSEHSIRPFLRAACVGAIRQGNRLDAAILEDKSGRRAIRARIFIDASGDGDLLRRAGFQAWQNDMLQPVTYQALIAGLAAVQKDKELWTQLLPHVHRYPYPTENSRPWVNSCGFPGDLNNVYAPRLNGVDASDADQLTRALLESRRCHRVLLQMARQELDSQAACVGLAQAMGVRETWHARCLHQVRVEELLSGKRFSDAIAFGTYPVDVHSPQGTLLRHLDGREELVAKDGTISWKRWRDESQPCTPYYQIPYRCLIPKEADNLLVAGRLLDADREAFGGLRVMVNMNQTGEAAGTAASLALKNQCTTAEIDTALLRQTMAEFGSLFPTEKRATVVALSGT
ncbi:MAG: FAD-dependent oxidoreductase [Candidatus Methylacidiphilales bacterium]|nr:FAD-dependent oxidoreductase [Candidatus Methylacidiphilales bacterium]